jgi:hypothetical protein
MWRYFDRSSSSNALSLRVCLKQETEKNRIEQCERSFVADASVERGGRSKSAAQFEIIAGVHCDLQRNRPPFRGHYGELNHADVSLLLNKKDGSHFGLVQSSDSARHLWKSVRELSDQASCFPNYKVAISLSAGAQHSVVN